MSGRRARLGTPQNRDLFLEVMERVRRHRFVVGGYVVMPEHVHLLFSGTHSPKTAASGAASVVVLPGVKITMCGPAPSSGSAAKGKTHRSPLGVEEVAQVHR